MCAWTEASVFPGRAESVWEKGGPRRADETLLTDFLRTRSLTSVKCPLGCEQSFFINQFSSRQKTGLFPKALRRAPRNNLALRKPFSLSCSFHPHLREKKSKA